MAKSIGNIISGLCDILTRSKREEDKTVVLGAIEILAGSLDKAPAAPAPARKRRGRAPKAPKAVVPEVPTAPAKPADSQKRKMSPQRMAALKLHGQLLGLLRQMPAKDRENIKNLRAKKGLPEALKAAQALRAKRR